MQLKNDVGVAVPPGLIEAIRTFPVEREVEHCGVRVTVSPFDFYATCAKCGERLKLRSFSAGDEVEDVFDAVFEWMSKSQADERARQRREQIQGEANE